MTRFRDARATAVEDPPMAEHVIFHGTCMNPRAWRLKRRRTEMQRRDPNMLRKSFAIGIVALACALPASASAATATSRGASAAVVVPIQLKAHPRLKAHRIISLELKQHPRLK
ncbi:MAG: hypothetical protein ABSB73_08485 [Solirubrobacteraceae bacterium]